MNAYSRRMAGIPDAVRPLLEGRNFGHLATVLPDGSPHSVAIWIGTEGDRVVFFTQPSSRKARNLARDPRVALSVVDRENPYRTARLRGRVVETRTGEAALPLIDAIAVRYTGQPFPMRSGTIFLAEVSRAALMELPFADPQ
jgi:PPOX class probable F420-dependent enzyme